MKTFHVHDIDNATFVVRGDRFTITDTGHLVISEGDIPKALFAERTWKAVREMTEP